MNAPFHGMQTIIQSLGWTLLYSFWQGLLISVCLFVVLKVIRNVDARIKYALSLFSLSGIFIWFVNTWIYEWQRLNQFTVYITEANNNLHTTLSYPINTTQPEPNTNQYLHQLFPQLEHVFPALVMIYVAGILFMLLKLSMNILRLRAFRMQGLSTVGNEWREWLDRTQKSLGIHRSISIFLSQRIATPMMMGIIKPVILIPLATINHLSIEELETILMHELAHIKRHDYLLNIFQTVVETIMFFNPFMWWISATVRREREHCCDEFVVANTNRPLSYAKALATLETYRINSGNLAMAASGNKNQLFNRIKRIMEMKKNTINYSQLTITILVITALILSMAWFTPSFAQTASKEGNTKTQNTTIVKKKVVVIDDNGNKKEYQSTKVTHPPGNSAQKQQDQMEDDNVNENSDMEAGDDSNMSISKTITTAFNSIDWHAIDKDIHTAMTQAQNSIEAIDWNEISDNINKGFKEAEKQMNDPKLREEIKVKMDEARKKTEEAMQEARVKTAEAMTKAREQMNDAKVKQSRVLAARKSESDSYEKMLSQMGKDGLIDKEKGFIIEKSEKSLYINGKMQPDDVYKKYNGYMDGRHIIIKGKNNGLNIDINS